MDPAAMGQRLQQPFGRHSFTARLPVIFSRSARMLELQSLHFPLWIVFRGPTVQTACGNFSAIAFRFSYQYDIDQRLPMMVDRRTSGNRLVLPGRPGHAQHESRRDEFGIGSTSLISALMDPSVRQVPTKRLWNSMCCLLASPLQASHAACGTERAPAVAADLLSGFR